MIAIFDKDMTLSDNRHRMKDGQYTSWAWTEEAIIKDKPSLIAKSSFIPIIENDNVKVYISTGAENRFRKVIIKWFEEVLDVGNMEDDLFMKTEDLKGLNSVEVKRANLHKIKELNPKKTEFLVFDDDEKTIEMYKEEGCKTCLVNI